MDVVSPNGPESVGQAVSAACRSASDAGALTSEHVGAVSLAIVLGSACDAAAAAGELSSLALVARELRPLLGDLGLTLRIAAPSDPLDELLRVFSDPSATT